MAEKTVLEPLLPVVESNPEVAIPVVVGYRGYETVRDIKSIYDSTQRGETKLRHRPQPFLRGSSLPASTYPINTRGGSFDPDLVVVPRDTEGKIDLDAVLRQREDSLLVF